MKKKNVFNLLAVFMMGFGIMMGVVFPFFVLAATSVPTESVINPLFFALCITAGFLVGLFNIYLAKSIVGKKMKLLSSHMKYVENRLIERARTSSNADCFDEGCYVQVISNDEIGESAKAFNSLVKALNELIISENEVKEFTSMLSSRLELDQLAEKALEKLIDNMQAVGGMIIIERDGELYVLYSYGFENPLSAVKSDVILKSFYDKKKRVINYPKEVYLNGVLVNFKPKSIVVEPITYKDVVLGAVVLAFLDEQKENTSNNMQLFSQGLALAFKNAITHDQLQKLAAKDPLTGIFNRRFGTTRFKEEYTRAVKTNQPLGVIMLDLDNFKSINDTYGHLVGDKVLVSVVNQVKSGLREGDVFMRYGGEEFFVVLPGASLKDVKMIGERVRRLVEESELKYNNRAIKLTISVGAASFPESSADDHLTLLEIADKRLYKAKELGRNQVITS